MEMPDLTRTTLGARVCPPHTHAADCGEKLSMASDVNDLTVNYTEDGVLVVKELDKKILSKGAWSTIIYRYQDWDKAKNDYGPDRYTIRRYQKRNGEYMQKSKFNISSRDQASSLIEALKGWIDD